VLGIENQEAFDALIKAKKDAEDAQKSEIQKLTEAAQQATDRATKLEADIQAAQMRFVDGEIKLLATQPVEKDVEVRRPAFRPDALGIVIALIDQTGITDDVSKLTGVDSALKALAKEKSFLLTGDDKPQAQAPKGTTSRALRKPAPQTQTLPATTIVVGTSLEIIRPQ
jgi:hypothetical protein